MNRQALEKLSRNELISKASGIGVPRAEVMTRMELVDEIVRRSITDENQRRRARGWLGVARDLVAGLIDQGLNMSDAAELVRGSGARDVSLRHQPPVATVTLAEIYASQGHTKRARNMLDEVLAKEPDHQFARGLRERLPEGKRAKPEPPQEQVAEDVPADAAVEVPLSVPPPTDANVDATAEAPVSQSEFVDVEAATIAGRVEGVGEEDDAEATTDPAPARQDDDAEATTDPAPAAVPPQPQVDEVDENAVTPPAPGVASAVADLAPAEIEAVSPVTPFVPTRDVLLVRRKDAKRVSLYWELVPAHAMETVVRLVAFVPDWSGAKRVEHQLQAHSAVGQATLEVPEGAAVRAVVGSHLGGAFRPLAVGVEIRGSARPEVAWAPSPVFRQRVTPALQRAFAALQS